MSKTKNFRTGFDRAVDFLLPDGCDENFKKELAELVKQRLYPKKPVLATNSDVYILWDVDTGRNPELHTLKKKYGISFGLKEVILAKDYVLLKENYHSMVSQPLSGSLF